MVWCENCKVARHLGQTGGAHASFGYGSTDTEGQRDVMEFIADHASHEIKDGLGQYLRLDETHYLRIGYDYPNDPAYKYLDADE